MNRYIYQPVKRFRFVSLFLVCLASGLLACHRPYYLHRGDAENYSFTQNSPKDSALKAFLQPYKTGVDTQMEVVIGHTDIMLTKAQPESSLGNFMADAQLSAARKIDTEVVLSVVNYGGIRLTYISPGAITRGKMYELMPFDNMLTIVEIPGSVLMEFCDFMVKAKGWPVSGLSFTIRDKKAENILVDAKPVNEHLVYKMVVSDYIARGGDNCEFLTPLKKKYTSVFLRDALIEYITRLEAAHTPLRPKIENRITYAE